MNDRNEVKDEDEEGRRQSPCCWQSCDSSVAIVHKLESQHDCSGERILPLYITIK